MPFVSIVIPTHNRSSMIAKSIESILAQTFTDWECLIVDDFSTDNGKEIVAQYAKKDPRVKYLLNQRKKGAQGARNTGVLNASGEWIAFNDSDDEWMPNKLEAQFTILKKIEYNPYVVIHGNCHTCDHATNTVSIWNLPIAEGVKPYCTLLAAPSPMFQGMLTSKKALQAVGYLDENVPSYQEWDTAIKLSKICTFFHIKEPLFNYHLHGDDSISKNIKKDIEGYNYIRLKYRDDFITIVGTSPFRISLINNIKRIIPYGYWNFGVDLLRKSKKYIPLKQYYFLFICFNFHINPDKLIHGLIKRKEFIMSYKK